MPTRGISLFHLFIELETYGRTQFGAYRLHATNEPEKSSRSDGNPEALRQNSAQDAPSNQQRLRAYRTQNANPISHPGSNSSSFGKTVQGISGHADPNTLLNTYAHSQANKVADLANSITKILA